ARDRPGWAFGVVEIRVVLFHNSANTVGGSSMKLLRYGEAGREKPGLLDRDGNVRDLSAQVKDITGEALSPDGLKRLAAINAAELPRVPSGVRLGAPVASFSKLIAIGLNYADHAAEAGMPIPSEPIFFM